MARRQTGDGWMDVGFFDVNARGNTSSIMATTAVVNFYILRATSPLPRNPILQPFYTHQSSPLNLGGCPPNGKQELCGYTSGADQKLRESFLHQLIIWTIIKCNSTYCLMDKFSIRFFFTRPLKWIKCVITMETEPRNFWTWGRYKLAKHMCVELCVWFCIEN